MPVSLSSPAAMPLVRQLEDQIEQNEITFADLISALHQADDQLAQERAEAECPRCTDTSCCVDHSSRADRDYWDGIAASEVER